MSQYLCYKDTVKLVTTSKANGYGDVEPLVLTDLACNFFQGTGSSRASHVEAISADAHAYVDYDNTELVSRAYRIEGMYIVANPFNAPDNESWYKITSVKVGQDKLLQNKIDNVHIYLQKAEAL